VLSGEAVNTNFYNLWFYPMAVRMCHLPHSRRTR